MHTMSYLSIIKELLKTDFKIFTRTIKDKVINLLIWIGVNAWVTSYMLPQFGLQESYSTFMVVGLAASAGLFEIFPSVAELVSDFTGERRVDFYTTLPIPTWLVFVRFFLFFSFSAATLGISVLPISKLFLWNRIDLSTIHLGKYLLIFVLTSLFFGAFTLWIAAGVKGLDKLEIVWMRLVFPLWFMGAFQFSWYALHQVSPLMAYLDLLNPITHAMEGTRAAVIGQAGSISFWMSALMLALFVLLCVWHAIRRLKKQLDFV